MHPSGQIYQVYEELADSFDQQQNHLLRDQFLLLAADAALSAGRQPSFLDALADIGGTVPAQHLGLIRLF